MPTGAYGQHKQSTGRSSLLLKDYMKIKIYKFIVTLNKRNYGYKSKKMRNELDQSTLNDQILKTPVCVFVFFFCFFFCKN